MSLSPPDFASTPTSPPSPLPPQDNATSPAASVGHSSTPPSPVDFVFPSPGGNRSPTSETQQRPGQSNNTTLVALGVGIGIGGALVLVCVAIFACWYKRRKRRLGLNGFGYGPAPSSKGDSQSHWQQIPPLPTDNAVGTWPRPTPPQVVSNSQPSAVNNSLPPPPHSVGSSLSSDHLQQTSADVGLSFSKSTFTYEELASATDHFSSTNLLGQGGFGYVHKGVLPNGKLVAIKQLKDGSGQGEREFQAEVEIIGRVHHKHLVSLVGHCISGDRRLLVYEFVPNKTLEFHLLGKGQPPINWETRIKIALGSAKGLAYLHEDCHPKIIHRDIKASNILLDDDFEAKVADFGLARLNLDTDTHVSTRVMGTFGYLAPEYALTGKLTDKSDVFSFGVVLLELITGRRPIDKSEQYLDDNIIDWARPLLIQSLDDGNYDAFVDPRMEKNYNPTEMARMVACAAASVRHLARRRPRMCQIVRALEGNLPLHELNEVIRPGHSTMYDDSYGSSDYDTAQYKEDLKKFRKMALESEEPNTSECSGPTSDFGPHPSGSSSEGVRTTKEGNSGDGHQAGRK